MLVSVALSRNIHHPLTYRHHGDQEPVPGTRVVVPLQNRIVGGWVTGLNPHYRGPTKKIIGIIRDPYLPDPAYLAFCEDLADQYLCSQGIILDHSLPPGKKPLRSVCISRRGQLQSIAEFAFRELWDLSRKTPLDLAYRHPTQPDILRDFQSPLPDPPRRAHLLSHNRLDHIREILENTDNRELPRLLLCTDNLTARYLHETLGQGFLYTSDLSPARREAVWRQARDVRNPLLIGGLGAAFLPVRNPGLILVDRSTAFKSMTNPYLPFRLDDVARSRAWIQGSSYREISGSLSMRIVADTARSRFQLDDRRKEKIAPVKTNRLLNQKKQIPGDFLEAVREERGKNRKMLVLVHKKKSDDYPYCPRCDRLVRCPECRGILRQSGPKLLVCLACHRTRRAFARCPRCKETLVQIRGISLSHVTASLTRLLGPQQVYCPAPRDYSKPGHLRDAILRHPITVAAMGIVSPFISGLFDRIFYLKPESFFDLKNIFGAETIYLAVNYLRELAGPAGQVILYTGFYFHYALRQVDYEEEFFKREERYRRWFCLPPYYDLYQVEMRDRDRRRLGKKMRDFFHRYRDQLSIRHIGLAEPQKRSGVYRGVARLHTRHPVLRESGILRQPGFQITRITGTEK